MLSRLVLKFHKCIRKTYFFSFREYKKLWFFGVLFLVLAGINLPKLKFLVMMSDLLDQDFQTYSQFHSLNKNFVEENQVSAIVNSRDGKLTFNQHCLVIRWLNKVHLENYSISKISSTYGLKEVVQTGNKAEVKAVLIPDCSEVNTAVSIQEQMKNIADSPSGHVLTNKSKTDVFASFYLTNLKKGNLLGHFNKNAFVNLRKSFNKHVEFYDSRLEVSWAGVGSYQYYLQKAYEQMNLINLFTGIILIFSFKLFFGKWKSGLILLTTYSVAMFILYGFMGYMNFPVDSLSAAVPIMLLIAILEDFLFVFLRYEKNGSLQASFQKALIPSFYTSLTTCFGFACLMTSELSLIKRFGAICAFGAIVEWILIFLILPKILDLWKKRDKTGFQLIETSPWVHKCSNVLSTIHVKKIIGFLCLVPIVYFLFNPEKELTINDSPEAVFPTSHPVPIATEKLLNGRGWKSDISLVFQGEEDKKITEKIVKTNDAIIGSESYEDVKKFVTRKLEDEDLKNYFYRNFDNSDFSERWLGSKSDIRRVFLYSNTTDVVEINKIRASVEIICEGRCYIANILVSYSEFGVKVLKTLSQSFSLSLIIITFILSLLCFYFQVPNKLFVIAAALWGPLCLMSVFVLFDIGVYFVTSVVMSVLVGLAGDNIFHFIFANKKGEDLTYGAESLANASIISLLLMIIVSASFLLSDFEGVRKIGIMMICGFVLGWIGDYLILKSLISKSRK